MNESEARQADEQGDAVGAMDVGCCSELEAIVPGRWKPSDALRSVGTPKQLRVSAGCSRMLVTSPALRPPTGALMRRAACSVPTTSGSSFNNEETWRAPRSRGATPTSCGAGIGGTWAAAGAAVSLSRSRTRAGE